MQRGFIEGCGSNIYFSRLLKKQEPVPSLEAVVHSQMSYNCLKSLAFISVNISAREEWGIQLRYLTVIACPYIIAPQYKLTVIIQSILEQELFKRRQASKGHFLYSSFVLQSLTIGFLSFQAVVLLNAGGIAELKREDFLIF